MLPRLRAVLLPLAAAAAVDMGNTIVYLDNVRLFTSLHFMWLTPAGSIDFPEFLRMFRSELLDLQVDGGGWRGGQGMRVGWRSGVCEGRGHVVTACSEGTGGAAREMCLNCILPFLHPSFQSIMEFLKQRTGHKTAKKAAKLAETAETAEPAAEAEAEAVDTAAPALQPGRVNLFFSEGEFDASEWARVRCRSGLACSAERVLVAAAVCSFILLPPIMNTPLQSIFPPSSNQSFHHLLSLLPPPLPQSSRQILTGWWC